jgi:hypothetical protein
MFGQTAREPAGEGFVNTAEYIRLVCGKGEICLAYYSYKLDTRIKICSGQEMIAICTTLQREEWRNKFRASI